ncbi:MAG: SMC family ATPase [Acidimicrobiia bacterium]|nr:SMC family ATPase [Acidimicrobiia bacterium]
MRPLELTLRNFRSYGDEPVTFDFRGRRLVGIVGPIGSGKSSILDAISFALYGRTPSLARGTKSLIHQRADGCLVTLRFSVDGHVWEVVRALRRKGQSQHNLYRLEADLEGAEPDEVVTLEGDVNQRIGELLGLDFDAFSRSVLLAQGRFSDFLRAAPAERDVVLKGLFGHERIDQMRQLAKDRVNAFDVELARAETEAANLTNLEARRSELASDIEISTERLTSLQKAMPAHQHDLELVQSLKPDIQNVKDRVDVLTGTNRPDQAEVEALANRATEVGSERETVAAELNLAEEALANILEKVKAGADERGKTAEALVLLADRRLQLARIEDSKKLALAHRQTVEKVQAEVKAAELRLEAASAAVLDDELEGARQAVKEAEEEVHRQQIADMAGTLRHDLEDGQPCPVCDRPVEVNKLVAGSPVALNESREKLRSEKERLTAVEKRHRQKLEERTGIEASLSQLLRRVEEVVEEVKLADESVKSADKQLQEQESALAALIGPGDPETIAGLRKEEDRKLDQQLEQARSKRDAIRTRHDQAIRDEQEATRNLSNAERSLAELAGRLDLDLDDLPADPSANLRLMLKLLEDEVETATRQLEKHEKELISVESRMADRLAELDVRGPLSDEIGRLEGQVKAQMGEADSLDDRIRKTSELLKGRDAQVTERDRYRRIVDDLSNANFVRYLLDVERQRLAELGSDHFQRLSAGRYRFDTDGSFNVIDLTAADAVRKPDSLSGGETFLASLGLALALAELVSRAGGRLDAFFLDEGFGSLDPEHLDLAMDGIEAVAAGATDRLVLVVSHVPELRERLEDLIELEKDAVSGNTRVLTA